jgi:lysophospholipase L1-like esterase
MSFCLIIYSETGVDKIREERMAFIVRRINRYKTMEPVFLLTALEIFLGYRQWVQKNEIVAIFIWFQTLVLVYAVNCSTLEPDNSVYNFVHATRDIRIPTLVCLGDSITHGRTSSDWVSTIQTKLSRPIQVVNNGQNSITTYTTLQERVNWTLACNPNYVVVLIGTNDTRALMDPAWHWLARAIWGLPGPITLTTIEANLRGILDKLLKSPNVQIAICTLPQLGEDLTSEWNQRAVKSVNDIIRNLAVASGSRVTLLDLYAALEAQINQSPTKGSSISFFLPHALWQCHAKYLFGVCWNDMSRWIGNVMLTDGIHLNDDGGAILTDMVVNWLRQQKHF